MKNLIFVITLLITSFALSNVANAYDDMTINGGSGEVCYRIGSVIVCN